MRIVLGVALAMSVVLNVVLFVRERGHGAEAAPSTGSASPEAAASSAAVASGAGGARGLDAPAGAVPVDCAHALFEAERHLADVRAQLWKKLPLSEKFDASQPNPAVEEPLRAELARLFEAKDLEGAAWTLECRGTTCQLQIVSTDAQKAAWMASLQTDAALRQRARGMGFNAGRPTNDQTSGTPLTESLVYMDVAEPGDDQQAGLAYLESIWRSFVASSAASDCSARLDSRAGSLDIRLDVNQDAAGVRAYVGGDLGATGAGRCVADRLQADVAAASPPVGTPPSMSYFVLELPPGTR